MHATLSAIWAALTMLWLLMIARLAFSDALYLHLQQLARENHWFFFVGLIAAVFIALGPPLTIYALGQAWRRADDAAREDHRDS